jgi:site-specific DNA recombinase
MEINHLGRVLTLQPLAYIRVSTDEQVEGNSLDEQQERLKAYCITYGLDEPIFYVDDGYSAKDMRRPAMTRLLDDAKQGKGKIVIITKIDRICRKLLDLLNLIDFLEKYQCEFASASEKFDTTTPAGRITLQILGAVAEFERARNAERVRDNMLSLARKGEKEITRPCYGYDIVDGVRFINYEESLIVRNMAEWAIKGEGGRSIAMRLNKMGIKTKGGYEWHERIVRELLKRETLIGNFVYNVTYKQGTRILKRPESEWIRITDHHDAILENETFEEIQRQFEGRKSIGRHVRDDTYLLSGLIRCGHCGSVMNGKKQQSRSKRPDQQAPYYKYVCDGYLKKGTCFYHYVFRDDLELLIIARIKEVAQAAPGSLQLVIAKPKAAPSLEKDVIIAKIERLDRKMQKQIEAYTDELITAEALKRATEQVEEDRRRLTQTLNELEEGNQSFEHQKVQETSRKLLGDVTSIDRIKAKNAIRQVVHSIRIENGETAEISWYAN